MIGRDCKSVIRGYATSSRPYKAGVTKGNIGTGSVPPIYTKCTTPYYYGVGPTYLHKKCHSLLFSKDPSGKSVTGSVPPIYTKCTTLYYSRSIPLANESGSEGGRRRVAVGAPLLPRNVDVIRTMGETIPDGAGGERSLFWGRWRVSIRR